MNNYNNKVEVLINLFTFYKGELKVLLFRKKTDPYKGYWMLPSMLLLNDETLEECTNKILDEMIGYKDVYIENGNIFSDLNRIPDTRIIGVSMIGLIDGIRASLKKEEREIDCEWFNVNNIPKTIYDHLNIVTNTTIDAKKKLLNTKNLKTLFPSDFTLPELQKVFEQILNEKLDRRNFRKKIIKLDILEDTRDKNIGSNGRPAKLYRFKDIIEDKELF